jgi:hypothetical protein
MGRIVVMQRPTAEARANVFDVAHGAGAARRNSPAL